MVATESVRLRAIVASLLLLPTVASIRCKPSNPHPRILLLLSWSNVAASPVAVAPLAVVAFAAATATAAVVALLFLLLPLLPPSMPHPPRTSIFPDASTVSAATQIPTSAIPSSLLLLSPISLLLVSMCSGMVLAYACCRDFD